MFPACPVRNILAHLCDKWALLVLYLLARSQTGKLRFTELRQAMPDISQKMLANDTAHARRGRLHHANALCGGSAAGRICDHGAERDAASDSRGAARMGRG